MLLIPAILFGVGFTAADLYQYQADILQNRANGAVNTYAPSSPVSDYLIGGGLSGFSTAFLGEYKLTASVVSTTGSLLQDVAAGRPVDFWKAGLMGAGTYATGSFFGATAGKSPLTSALSVSSASFSSPSVSLGLKYETSQAVFQNSSMVLAQNTYSSSIGSSNSASKPARSVSAPSQTSSSSSGGIISSIGLAIKSVTNFITGLWK